MAIAVCRNPISRTCGRYLIYKLCVYACIANGLELASGNDDGYKPEVILLQFKDVLRTE